MFIIENNLNLIFFFIWKVSKFEFLNFRRTSDGILNLKGLQGFKDEETKSRN